MQVYESIVQRIEQRKNNNFQCCTLNQITFDKSDELDELDELDESKQKRDRKKEQERMLKLKYWKRQLRK